jgi:fluoride ion exporter CrcB/FEX
MLDADRDRKNLTKVALNILLSIILGVIAAWAGLQIVN